jgi:hypothetical protein
MMICEKLPEDKCYDGYDYYEERRPVCKEDQFDCGDGTCVHGLKLCDNRFDCRNGADELSWLV